MKIIEVEDKVTDYDGDDSNPLLDALWHKRKSTQYNTDSSDGTDYDGDDLNSSLDTLRDEQESDHFNSDNSDNDISITISIKNFPNLRKTRKRNEISATKPIAAEFIIFAAKLFNDLKDRLLAKTETNSAQSDLIDDLLQSSRNNSKSTLKLSKSEQAKLGKKEHLNNNIFRDSSDMKVASVFIAEDVAYSSEENISESFSLLHNRVEGKMNHLSIATSTPNFKASNAENYAKGKQKSIINTGIGFSRIEMDDHMEGKKTMTHIESTDDENMCYITKDSKEGTLTDKDNTKRAQSKRMICKQLKILQLDKDLDTVNELQKKVVKTATSVSQNFSNRFFEKAIHSDLNDVIERDNKSAGDNFDIPENLTVIDDSNSKPMRLQTHVHEPPTSNIVIVFDQLNPLNNILLPPNDFTEVHKYNPLKAEEKLWNFEGNRQIDKHNNQAHRVGATKDYEVRNMTIQQHGFAPRSAQKANQGVKYSTSYSVDTDELAAETDDAKLSEDYRKKFSSNNSSIITETKKSAPSTNKHKHHGSVDVTPKKLFKKKMKSTSRNKTKSSPQSNLSFSSGKNCNSMKNFLSPYEECVSLHQPSIQSMPFQEDWQQKSPASKVLIFDYQNSLNNVMTTPFNDTKAHESNLMKSEQTFYCSKHKKYYDHTTEKFDMRTKSCKQHLSVRQVNKTQNENEGIHKKRTISPTKATTKKKKKSTSPKVKIPMKFPSTVYSPYCLKSTKHGKESIKKNTPDTKSIKSNVTKPEQRRSVIVKQLIAECTGFRQDHSNKNLNENLNTNPNFISKTFTASSKSDVTFSLSKSLWSMKNTVSTINQESTLPKKNNFYSGAKRANVVATINMLPFMGSHECEWESSVADTWSFRLLYWQLRLMVRLAHRLDNAIRTLVRGDTPVHNISVKIVCHDTKDLVAKMCLHFAYETMRLLVQHVLRSKCVASDIPPLLQQCANIVRVALRWKRAMDDAKQRLAYTLDSSGNISWKVANIPLRSVWEVTMRVELILDSYSSLPCPRATNVRVVPVESDVLVPSADVQRVLLHMPKDWGHAPGTIWRLYKLLKQKTRDDNPLR